MITDSVRSFFEVLPSRGRLLGLDLGSKTVGLSLSDLARQIATPMDTIRRIKYSQDAAKIQKICNEQLIKGLVIGLPKNMDGSEGKACQISREFSRLFFKSYGLPTLLWDERLSTAAVTKTMVEADLSRKRQAKIVDKMASAYILQGALDAIESQRNAS